MYHTERKGNAISNTVLFFLFLSSQLCFMQYIYTRIALELFSSDNFLFFPLYGTRTVVPNRAILLSLAKRKQFFFETRVYLSSSVTYRLTLLQFLHLSELVLQHWTNRDTGTFIIIENCAIGLTHTNCIHCNLQLDYSYRPGMQYPFTS